MNQNVLSVSWDSWSTFTQNYRQKQWQSKETKIPENKLVGMCVCGRGKGVGGWDKSTDTKINKKDIINTSSHKKRMQVRILLDIQYMKLYKEQNIPICMAVS